jgi:exosortase
MLRTVSSWKPSLLYFGLYAVIMAGVFGQGVVKAFTLASSDNRYTHLAVVPVLSVALILFESKRVFSAVRRARNRVLALTGAIFATAYGVLGLIQLPAETALSLAIAVFLSSLVAGFAACFGISSARKAAFSLGLLLLAVPLPSATMELAEAALQRGSADATHLLFQIFGTPVYREGLVFSLPGVVIEVAKECSGIRSAISLLITALIMGYLGLRSNWRRAVCVLLVIPIAVLKNAIRIFSLSWLAVYVSPSYLTGDLHRQGGPVFAVISLALLIPAIWILRKSESAGGVGAPPAATLTG